MATPDPLPPSDRPTDQPAPQPTRVSPDDMLPPVEPPSATFILQLFLIPLLIVGIIVVVWLGVSYLAHKNTSPLDLIRQMESPHAGSWQAASNLASMLNDPKYNEIKKDPEVLARLANLLNAQIEAQIINSNDEKDKPEAAAKKAADFRVYICHALAQFHLPEAAVPLVKAAKEDSRPEVREAAIESLAILGSNVTGAKLRSQPDVLATLLEASRDFGDNQSDGSAMRYRAAFALGVIGGPEATEQLVRLLSDPHADVRFNAAPALAREGDIRAIPVLARMIDPDNKEGLLVERDDKTHSVKQTIIMGTGVKAARQLFEKNPTADMSAIKASLEKAAAAGPTGPVATEAKELLIDLDKK